MISKAYAETTIGNLKTILATTGNPNEQGFDTILAFIRLVVDIVMQIAGIIAFLMIIYGGILYLTAYGQEAKLETAKKTLIWSIVGFVLIVFASYIVKLITHQLQSK